MSTTAHSNGAPRAMMKQHEFQPCIACGQGMMHGGAVTFYRLRVERMVINVGAVREQVGLEMILRSPALAFHMGPQRDLASAITEPDTALICDRCAVHSEMPIAEIHCRAVAASVDQAAAREAPTAVGPPGDTH